MWLFRATGGARRLRRAFRARTRRGDRSSARRWGNISYRGRKRKSRSTAQRRSALAVKLRSRGWALRRTRSRSQWLLCRGLRQSNRQQSLGSSSSAMPRNRQACCLGPSNDYSYFSIISSIARRASGPRLLSRFVSASAGVPALHDGARKLDPNCREQNVG